MASYLQGDGGCSGNRAEEVRTQFQTREGVYKLMRLSEYSRPTRFPAIVAGSPLFRVSFVTPTDPPGNRLDDIIAFNIGKELYVYYYNGIRKAADLTRPLEKKLYKGTGPSPTCHDFNSFTATGDRVFLLIGFTHGQVLLTEIMMKEHYKMFNDQRHIDSTKVTCTRWLPNSETQFLVAHSSGSLYLYDDRLQYIVAPPNYQLLVHGTGFSVHYCYPKVTRSPVHRWTFEGGGAVHDFAFSPCTQFLAVACASGHLRIFHYVKMEPIGVMRSYFGGLRCVAWSPDGRYIATGGEDDHISVWSTAEQRVVCRGAGHQSWISSIAFDPFTSSIPGISAVPEKINGGTFCATDINSMHTAEPRAATCVMRRPSAELGITSYRIGSVSDDTHLCLWDLTEDVLINRGFRSRANTVASASGTNPYSSLANGIILGNGIVSKDTSPLLEAASAAATDLPGRFASLSIADQHRQKEANAVKRFGTLGAKPVDSKPRAKPSADALTPLGSTSCPRLTDVPILEPLVCKKIAHEQLTTIVFREDCIVTACQDGIVSTWSRPDMLFTSGYL